LDVFVVSRPLLSSGSNALGGRTVSVRDAKGQIIRYDNTSGNAGGITPHLHHQVSC
jgi:hypothetical protein